MTDDDATVVSREAARAAKKELRAALTDEAGVQGVGLSRADDGGWAVVINVTSAVVRERAEARLHDRVGTGVGDQFHTRVGAVPVRIRVIGQVRAGNTDPTE